MLIGNSTYILSDVIDKELYRMSDIDRFSGRLVHKKENIAEHSFYVAFKVIQLGNKYHISEDKINKAVRIALCHDCGEIYTGDIPHSLKVYSNEIKIVSEKLEVELISKYFPEFGEYFKLFNDNTDPIITNLVIAADILDVIMYIDREESLGNRDPDILSLRNECTERYIKVISKLKQCLEEENG